MKAWMFATGAVAVGLSFSVEARAEKKCVHIEAYHAGYGWSDGITQGIDAALAGKCKVERFRMDTKNNSSPDFAKKKGEEAKAFIDSQKPDLVIVTDDNAAKWVLQPFYKDSQIPFVFAGLNWTIDQYGLPYKHTTGMIEVAPIQPMIQEIKKSLPALKTVAFVTMDNETEQKDLVQVTKLFKGNNVEVKPYMVKTFDAWKAAFVEAQSADVVYVSNNAGISGWDNAAAADHVAKNAKKLTVSIYDWMAPYAALIFVKSAYEQGEWAGKAAAEILGGKAPNKIQVVTNKKYEPMINTALHEKSPVKMSKEFVSKAKAFDGRSPAAAK